MQKCRGIEFFDTEVVARVNQEDVHCYDQRVEDAIHTGRGEGPTENATEHPRVVTRFEPTTPHLL